MKIVVLGNQARAVANFWTVLMRHMRAGGHDVICTVPAGDPAAEARILAASKPVLPAEGVRMPSLRILHYPLDRKGINPFRDMATFAALYRIFREEQPDLLFASTIKPVIYGCMAARLARVPHIYATITGLGYVFEADSRFKRWINCLSVFLYRQALAGARGIFFQNRDDLRTFQASGIIGPSSRVLMVRGTGVDTRHFAVTKLPPLPKGKKKVAPEKREIVFLLVGRLLEAKGLREYAMAARQLTARYPRCRFQLLGPEEQGLGSVSLETVRQWAGDSLEYLGATSDVRPYVTAAHVLVLPSWHEGAPTAIMEGMSMGRPAVVTDAPGCRELVTDGVNGRLCRLRDPQSLAAAMEHFILHPEDIARMGAQGRELACRDLDADIVSRRILDDMFVPLAPAQPGESAR